MSSLPRPEYPRPQFVRDDWLCLNGAWQFEIDQADSGLDRGLRDRPLQQTITVPFAPESALSGVHRPDDFLNCVWYRREVTIPAAWQGRHTHLHFQAVDRDATVWIHVTRDGRTATHEVARHRGGWCGFSANLSPFAQPGETVTLVVRARDDMKIPGPHGKQVARIHNVGCHYTRTTGIWQTVWLEPVPPTHLLRPRITPDVAQSRFVLEQSIADRRDGTRLRVTLLDGPAVVCQREAPANRDFTVTLDLPIPEAGRKLWEPGRPHLYDVSIELLDADGAVLDSARSYAGLRSVTIEGLAVRINGKPVFQRTVLDQGFYPDGLLTAPSDQALIDDITLSLDVGFNGARLHQKVFEERFLYHADRLGYLVWGEFGDWGIDRKNPAATIITQWLEVLHRDYSHPSIIGWCGLNETAEPIGDDISGLNDLTLGMFLAAKAIDRSRPVLDASGYSHRVPETDVWDSHDYDQKPQTFRERHAGTPAGTVFTNAGQRGEKPEPWSIAYRGQPCWVSEFGGTWWNPDLKEGDPSWGYGDRPKTLEDFYARFDQLCTILLENAGMFGYCYTQLTDVFQEQNGLYSFDRRPKFDPARLRAIQQKRAAIEEQR
jgi:beta-galactosidase/beta-glucuronidase